MSTAAIVGGVPNPEAQAYGHSLLNWLRFNHRDIPNAAIYVALCAVLLLAAWGSDVLFNHFVVSHVTAYHHTPGTLPPYRGPAPTIPSFKP